MKDELGLSNEQIRGFSAILKENRNIGKDDLLDLFRSMAYDP